MSLQVVNKKAQISMTPAPALSARGLAKSFRRGSIHAVRGISFDVQEGEVVGLLGHNGAGKTTLIDLIVGLTSPTAGSIEVYGLKPRQAIARGLVGAMLQNGSLLPILTVSETLRMVQATYSQHLPLEEILEICELNELASRKVAACSGGEQQRVKLAIALLGDPHLLLLDEPTTAMDPSARQKLWDALERFAARGKTVLFSTHYLKEAEDFAHRLIILKRGRVIASGTPQEILQAQGEISIDVDYPGDIPPHIIDLSSGYSRHGHTHHFLTRDSDYLAKALLLLDGAQNLRISAMSLDELFALEKN
ncbi:ABC transporter ATP-binding protein [Corynebacterium sp. ES2775-CONJ]|nr:ABC transporter ATP-binding protein [Corynebacterium sp. ES2775-CONJ]